MDCKRKITRGRIAATIYLLSALLFFLPVPVPYKIALPLLTLTIFSFGLLPWQMCLACAFCCMGDLAGSLGSVFGETALIVQIVSFGVGHLFYIWFFLSDGLKQKRFAEAQLKKESKNKKKHAVQKQGMYMAAVLAITMIVVYNAMDLIVPCVDDDMVRKFVIGYVALISVMMWSALMSKDWIWGLGAVLFVISDFILAWDTFVESVPAKKYLVMVPYYAAQAILFFRTSQKNRLTAD